MTVKPGTFGRIYRLKLFLAVSLLATIGISLTLVADEVESLTGEHLAVSVLRSLSDILLIAGAIGIAVDFFTGRDKEAADTERLRSVLKDTAPDIRDAVIAGFTETPDTMRGVSTNETLDKLATNALALRLGDERFAGEVYADVRDQAIRAAERWHDVEVNVRLSTAVARGTGGTPRFDVLVEWEYTTVPSHAVRRFACVSDRDEFDDLVTEVPSTSTWFMTPRTGLLASSKEAFELLYFSIDGQERKIRRSERRTGQTYSVAIGDDVISSGKPVRIKHLYRTTVTQAGHYLFIELPQPTRDLSLKFDYTDAAVSRLTVMDLVTSAQRPEIVQMPAQVDARVVSVDLRGWLLPRAGFTFVWTLASEDQPTDAADASSRARAA